MVANATDVVTVAQLKDYDEHRPAGGGESASQLFTVTGGESPRTVTMNGWNVQVPGGTGGTYVFLASKAFIVLHAMRFTAKTTGNMTIYHNSAQKLRSSATAYDDNPKNTAWPIFGSSRSFQEISDSLEVTMTTKNLVGIKIAAANNDDGYRLNDNIKVNFCVWIDN